jgi:hypothetical protein
MRIVSIIALIDRASVFTGVALAKQPPSKAQKGCGWFSNPTAGQRLAI